MLDPLPLKYRDALMKKNGLLNIAARAPRLSAEYKNDFIAYADECLRQSSRAAHSPSEAGKEKLFWLKTIATGFIMVRSFSRSIAKV